MVFLVTVGLDLYVANLGLDMQLTGLYIVCVQIFGIILFIALVHFTRTYTIARANTATHPGAHISLEPLSTVSNEPLPVYKETED